jgi:hypothetical protein
MLLLLLQLLLLPLLLWQRGGRKQHDMWGGRWAGEEGVVGCRVLGFAVEGRRGVEELRVVEVGVWG